MKEYKRLTKRDNEFGIIALCPSCSRKAICDKQEECVDCITEEQERLAELEDKIENGTLIGLPCKYGDTVWFVYETENNEMFLDEGVIQSFSIDSCGLWFYVIYKSGLTYWHTIESLGERVFLTKAEAEAKLKELQNER